MSDLINLTDVANAFLPFINQLNNIANQMVGFDAYWMRSVPHKNSEDVIFHEYTLHDVECPKKIKLVSNNTSYNPGNFTIDYFGINYEAPLEVSVTKDEWESVFGVDTMPQQRDVVFVEYLNCLYEVASSTIEFGFANREQGFKMQMTKWNPRANVRLSDSIEETINDLTVGEAELFGTEIARQVSDMVDDPEISGLVNTYEPEEYKTCDIESIISKDVSIGDNVIAKSYYNLGYMNQSIIYKSGDEYNLNDRFNQRFFSCWFKIKETNEEDINVGSLQYENGHYYINHNVQGLYDSDEIELIRGKHLCIHAITNRIVTANGKTRIMLTFNNSEFRDITKKITNWNQNLILKKNGTYSLLVGRTSGQCSFNISIIGSKTLLIKFGSKTRRVSICDIPKNEWCGIAINLGLSSDVRVFIPDSLGVLKMTHYANLGPLENNFKVGEFYIPQNNMYLTKIRYYQTDEIVSEKQAEKDLTWVLSQNDGLSIINDNALTPNIAPFITSQK